MSRRIATVIGLGGLLAFFALGVGLTLESLHFGREAIRAMGTVVELQPRPGKRCTMWTPVVRFRDPSSGREFEITSKAASCPPGYAVGDAVPVLYRPGQARHARIDSFSNRWLLPTIVLALGSFCLTFCLVALYLRQRSRRAP